MRPREAPVPSQRKHTDGGNLVAIRRQAISSISIHCLEKGSLTGIKMTDGVRERRLLLFVAEEAKQGRALHRPHMLYTRAM